MNRMTRWTIAICAALLIPASLRAATDAELAATALKKAQGASGGLVVALANDGGQLATDLAEETQAIVHALSTDAADVQRARALFAQRGIVGAVSAARLVGSDLPYINNTVNMLVAEDLGAVSMDEVMRVLIPNGVAIVKQGGKWQTTTKPWPGTIDEWTHYMHSPSNNAVADDSEIGPPRRVQWLGGPRWSRHHDHVSSMNAMVSAKGKLFYIMDEGQTGSALTPSHWMLTARDAFNGATLWKREIPTWIPSLWPLKSGPANLPRRLVAVDQTVYVPLGYEAPISALDAATGELKHEFAGSELNEEIIVDGDLLLTLVLTKPIIVEPTPGMLKEAENAKRYDTRMTQAPLISYYWQTVTSRKWFDSDRVIKAYNAKTGEELWKAASKVMPLTLSCDDAHVYIHDGEKVVAFDRESGDRAYETEPVGVVKDHLFSHFAPTMVVKDGVIVFAGGEELGQAWMGWEFGNDQGQDTMTAFDAATGKKLWSAPHPYGGYQSPEDVLIAQGLVWSADTANGKHEGPWIGRDLHTGEVAKEIPPTVKTSWFHHRCYRAKATEDFLIPSRNGVEFIDIEKKEWDINHWVRSTCLYGVMPANGLLYNSPHNCACHPQAKLSGFNALASIGVTPPDVADDKRLEHGPAYGAIKATDTKLGDWPMYRRDTRRSGYSPGAIDSKLTEAWSVQLSGKLTQSVVRDGLLVVSEIDAQTVHAFDAATGEARWNHIAGGRVDSPPTLAEGRVLFGSSDGYVTCLRASDGALVWRFLAAPADRRLVSYGQVESVWPVNGSVLVHDGEVFFMAGRSYFLDDGVRFYRLNLESGRIVITKTFDNVDFKADQDLQARASTLDMPVGLPDILAADGDTLFMRSQLMDKNGERVVDLAHHLFAPFGFVDDAWFHRAYWVYGKNYYGGAGGYSKAGKQFPSGRMIVHDDSNVYAFGRVPSYYRWITEMDYQLYQSPRADAVLAPGAYEKAGVQAPEGPSLNVKGKPFTVEAWVKAPAGEGVILCRGAQRFGYDLTLAKGKAAFDIVSNKTAYRVASKESIGKNWAHIVGVLTAEEEMRLYVNGELAARKKAAFLTSEPSEGMEIGLDDNDQLLKRSRRSFMGMIDEVRVYDGALSDADVAARFKNPTAAVPTAAKLALRYSFDDGTATDLSGAGNDGKVGDVDIENSMKGLGSALAFKGAAKGPVREWVTDLPLYVRAMAKAGDTLIVAGPPDLVNEAEVVRRLPDRAAVAELARQDAAYRGELGGVLWLVSAKDGAKLADYSLDTLPAHDAISVANGRLYIGGQTGVLTCMKASE